MPRYRLLIPLSAALFSLLIFTALSLHIRSQEHYAVRVHLEEISTNLRYNLAERVAMDLAGLERMANRWVRADGLDEAEWRADAQAYVHVKRCMFPTDQSRFSPGVDRAAGRQ